MTGDYLARGAMVMTEAELARLEFELLHGARPRSAPPAPAAALAWTADEMRVAERRVAAGLPLIRLGPGKAG